MVSFTPPDRLTLPIAPAGAAAAWLFAAGFFLLIPIDALEDLVVGSGASSLVNAAAPPLGLTARLVLALGLGGGLAVVVWSGLFLLLGERRLRVTLSRRPRGDGVPVVRRADAHPDAPPRRPLTAAELTGTPAPLGRADYPVPSIPVPMSGPQERTVPSDLDTPLSALDPAAIPVVPKKPVRPVASLAPGERMHTFALTPPAPPKPQPQAEMPSIDALLRRLEQGAGRRVGAR